LWKIQGSNSNRIKRFSLVKYPDRLQESPSLLLSGQWGGSPPGISCQDVRLTTDLPVVAEVKKCSHISAPHVFLYGMYQDNLHLPLVRFMNL
jgi:hypothetical protein